MTYSDIENRIEQLKMLPQVEYEIIGYSTLKKPIYAFHMGSYEGNQIFIEGGIHAREYISSLFLLEEIEFLSTQELNGGVYIVPLVNPDGVNLVLDGVDFVECEVLKEILILLNNNSTDFSLWKANAMGVDLNVNFDTLWGMGIQNVFCPGSENFVGYFPNSERENLNLINYVTRVNPQISLSYHSKGEVIYYGFETLSPEQLERDRYIADIIANETGYLPIRTTNSTGGFSDWVSLHLEIPAFTIEVGNEELAHPIGEEQLPIIFEQNKYVPIVLLNYLNE